MRLVDAGKVAEAIAWLNDYDFVIWHDIMERIIPYLGIPEEQMLREEHFPCAAYLNNPDEQRH